MYKKINVYVNGIYKYSTNHAKNCADAVKQAHATKHIVIATLPKPEYLTIYDYDKVTAKYAK